MKEDDINRKQTLQLLRQLAIAIERLFSPLCEVVIHDFTDFEHSIVHLEGDVSHRHLGGAATNLLLERARTGDTDSDLYCYTTRLPGDRVMKSSTVFLRDNAGQAYGAFCINYDITALTEIERVIGAMTLNDANESIAEVLSDDINETIRVIISEALAESGGEPRLMSRDGKIEFVARLDSKGLFQVKKAAPIVADHLGVSRATVYNYLREVRCSDLADNSDNEFEGYRDGAQESRDG